MEKTLPHDTDAERAVLGSLIIDPEAIVEVHGILSADDFYRDSHREIYAAIAHLYVGRAPADTIMLAEELERTGKLDAIGGLSALFALSNDVPTSANAAHYAQIVARKAMHRRRIQVAGQIATLSYEESEQAQTQAVQLLDTVETHGHGADFTAFSDVLLECMNEFQDMRADGSIVGVPSGYHGLDVLTGGFQKSDLILVAARPAGGKTTLAQNVAYNAMLQSDARIAFFSLEMSRKQLGHRFISIDSRIDSQRLRMGQIAANLGEWDTIADTMKKLSDGHLWIDDTAGIDIDVLCSRAKRLAHKQGLDLIIVDYIGLVHATINGKRPDMTQKELSEVSRKLKQLAMDLNVPVLALAQMNRGIEARSADTVPQLSDLRDSGALEQDADIVIFLHRAKEQTSETIDLIVAKHRNGPNGQVRLGFDGRHTRFYDLNEFGEEETRR